ncbi:MAG: hypothetical protein JWM53_3540, partial [bacterium]|nr:hypothetical protein [bacterium]
GYCAQYNAPYLALAWPWTVAANHDLTAWDSQLDTMPDAQISCMFASRF